MQWSRRALAATLVLATVATATAQASSTVETIVQDDALMLHGDDAGVRRGMERSRELGIDRVRLTAGWSVIAPDPDSPQPPEGFDATDPAAYPAGRWAHLDRAVRIAREVGLAPMIDIAFWAPRWATKEPGDVQDRYATEIDAAHYAAFATAVARRYSGSWTPPVTERVAQPSEDPQEENILTQLLSPPKPPPPAPTAEEVVAPEPLPAVDTFTIWNEPNHPGFVRPQWVKVDGRWVVRSAEIYREMVRAAYPAIRGAAPGSRILVGGTASMGSSTPGVAGVPPLRFLRELACVDEQLQPVTTGSCAGYERLPGDGWSHHPYSLRTTPDVDTRDRDKLPVAATARLAETLQALVRNGRIDARMADIYLTEYGYETNRPDPNAPFSLDQQAGLLAWAEQIATQVPSVRSWPQFQLYDRPDTAPRPGMRDYGDWHSGLYFNDGTPKPAAAVYGVPFNATCAGKRVVMVWGRLRGHLGDAAATLEARRGSGAWRPIASGQSARGARTAGAIATAHGHAIRRYVRHRRGTQYRLQWSSGAGSRTSASSAPVCRRVRKA